MNRTVYVFRAEEGAQSIFGGQSASATPPGERQPIRVFTIVEEEPDTARRMAIREAQRVFHETPDQVSMAVDGSIHVTLRAPAARTPRL